MTDVLLMRHRIQPGKTETLRELYRDVRNGEYEHLDEVDELLRREGMSAEALFIEETEEADFLVRYVESDDLDHALETYQNDDSALAADIEALLDDVLVNELTEPDVVTEASVHVRAADE